MLEAAAVIGKEFFVGAVRDLVPEDRRAEAARRMDGIDRTLIRRIFDGAPRVQLGVPEIETAFFVVALV